MIDPVIALEIAGGAVVIGGAYGAVKTALNGTRERVARLEEKADGQSDRLARIETKIDYIIDHHTPD